jgi:hypothetical protein
LIAMANSPKSDNPAVGGTWFYWIRRTSARVAVVMPLVLAGSQILGGCTMGLRSAVSMKVNRSKTTPRDASVYIDEEFIGPLYYVSAHGVRLPTGKHRISIARDGYFPWDRLVEADRQPIFLDVELIAIPD